MVLIVKNVKIHFANQGERYLLQVDLGCVTVVNQDLENNRVLR